MRRLFSSPLLWQTASQCRRRYRFVPQQGASIERRCSFVRRPPSKLGSTAIRAETPISPPIPRRRKMPRLQHIAAASAVFSSSSYGLAQVDCALVPKIQRAELPHSHRHRRHTLRRHCSSSSIAPTGFAIGRSLADCSSTVTTQSLPTAPSLR